jgi:uncharacterized protein YdhG (YjbR/CyaY superfamily)
MTKTKFSNVDEYISVQPEAAKVALLVRTTIRKAVPGAEEMISYNMPAYKLQGGITLYFAGWRQHYSLYPASERLVPLSRSSLHRTWSERGQSVFHSRSRFQSS